MNQEKKFALFINQTLGTLVFLGLFLFFSCKKEQEKLDPSPGNGLVFSTDTIFFDTVFTTQKTVTMRMRVYNPNEKAINIKSVFVNGAEGYFPFTFHINGRFGPTKVTDVELEGKDSAYVLVSALVDTKNENLPFIIEDNLHFEIQGRSEIQKVALRAYGQDAIYYREGQLECNSVWKKGRPIIFLDTVSVPKGCTLTVEAGARIYGYNGAALLVRGTLLVNGTLEDSVFFQGYRRESYYQNAPGQWFGIWFFDGNENEPMTLNQISHATIKNAYRSIQVGEVGKIYNSKPFLLIQNCRIQNVVDYGILSLQSNVLAINNQFADCGQDAFAGFQGGVYELFHNTFGESGNNPFQRETPMVVFTDHFPPNNNWSFGAPLRTKLINNIVAGGEDNELNFIKRGPADLPFDTLLFGNIIKSKDYNYFVSSPRAFFNQKFISGSRFQAPLKYNFRPDTATFTQPFGTGISLDTLSSKILTNSANLKAILKKDITGIDRPISQNTKPDIGAYQSKP